MQVNAAGDEAISGASHDGRDEFLRPVAHEQRRCDVLAAKDVVGMLGDVLGDAVVDRVGQVVTERDHDPALRPESEHDQAPARIETEHVRDDRKNGIRRGCSQLNLAR